MYYPEIMLIKKQNDEYLLVFLGDPIFLCSNELKKFASTPSPGLPAPGFVGSTFEKQKY